jgi:hypothetical protein
LFTGSILTARTRTSHGLSCAAALFATNPMATAANAKTAVFIFLFLHLLSLKILWLNQCSISRRATVTQFFPPLAAKT